MVAVNSVRLFLETRSHLVIIAACALFNAETGSRSKPAGNILP